MKFPAHALLACSFLVQPSLAYQLRSANSELQGCFEKCGKDADKIDKVESCQLDCVDSQVATGRTRSNVGPNGADSLLLCGSTCAVRANEKYENKIGNYDKPKCSCDKDNDECKKKCKDKENEKKKQNKKNAEDGAEEKYKNCNDKCFGDESAFSFNLSTALKNFKPAVRSSKDEAEKCFKKCGDKDPDDADKINECLAECVDDEVSNGRARSAIGPRGADNLLLCGSGCAVESEDEYDKELKKSKKDIKEALPDKKECESMCSEDDEGCIKECEKAIKDIEKELKKEAEDEAEDEATKKYERCNKKCFEEPDSHLSTALKTALKNFKPAVRSSKDEAEKCFKKCGDKDPDDADKINECLAECVDDEVSNGRARSAIGPRGADNLLLCGSGCAVESEDEYDKELKKSKKDIKEALPDKKECENTCSEDDEGCIKECEKAIKDIEKELKKAAEDEAEDEATKKYERCNKKCFEEPSSKFKLGYVA